METVRNSKFRSCSILQLTLEWTITIGVFFGFVRWEQIMTKREKKSDSCYGDESESEGLRKSKDLMKWIFIQNLSAEALNLFDFKLQTHGSRLILMTNNIYIFWLSYTFSFKRNCWWRSKTYTASQKEFHQIFEKKRAERKWFWSEFHVRRRKLRPIKKSFLLRNILHRSCQPSCTIVRIFFRPPFK